MTHQEIEESLRDMWFNNRSKERTITIHTGVGGMDLFDEAIDESMGYKRIRIGKKVLRILRVLKPVILKNKAGVYYKLVSTKKN